MDPTQWYHLGRIRQCEYLEAAEEARRQPDQEPILRPLIAQVGRLMIAAGEWLVTAARPAFEDVATTESHHRPEAC